MSSFKLSPKKQPEQFRVQKAHFLGEQDGVPERELKYRLVEYFKCDQDVRRAYLAKVAYDDQSPITVALCLCCQVDLGRGLSENVGNIFASIFGAHECMDILFLTDAQESELKEVCRSFF